MTRALAYLIRALKNSKNFNFLSSLAKSNKKTVPNLIFKSDKFIGKETQKLTKLLNKPTHKGTFTNKFYKDGYNLTDNFGKTDWQTYFELSKRYPGLVKTWQGPKFPKGLKFRRTNKERLTDEILRMMKEDGNPFDL